MYYKTKFYLATLALAVLLVPVFAAAAELRGGEEYFLRKDEAVSDDLYVGAGNVSVVGDVDGDLVVGGGNVTVIGDVGKDLTSAGGTLTLSGNVGDDLRAGGGDIRISGTVGDDVAAAGGQIHLIAGSVVRGDVVSAGGRVVVDGNVLGDVTIIGGEILINGEIGGDVELRGDEVTIGGGAVISGDLTYRAKRKAFISDGAKILGEIKFIEAKSPIKDIDFNIASLLKWLVTAWLILKLLMLIAAGLVLVLVFREKSRHLVKCVFANFWRELIRGLVVLIVVPVAVVILLFTLIGAPLAILVGLVYALMVLIAKIYAGVLFGSWLHKAFTKQREYKLTWPIALLGIVALYFVSFVPLLGWLVGFGFMLVALGVISRVLYEHFWTKKK